MATTHPKAGRPAHAHRRASADLRRIEAEADREAKVQDWTARRIERLGATEHYRRRELSALRRKRREADRDARRAAHVLLWTLEHRGDPRLTWRSMAAALGIARSTMARAVSLPRALELARWARSERAHGKRTGSTASACAARRVGAAAKRIAVAVDAWRVHVRIAARARYRPSKRLGRLGALDLLDSHRALLSASARAGWTPEPYIPGDAGSARRARAVGR